MTDEEKIRNMVRRVVYRTLGIRDTPSRRIETGQTTLVTEQQLHDASPGGRLVVPEGALITPLARQAAMERNIRLVKEDAPPAREAGSIAHMTSKAGDKDKTVAIGADHGGFKLKQALKKHIHKLGWNVVDCGTDSAESVDYPDFALMVARMVAREQVALGIIVDGAGIGSCMAANKVPGVRAALCYDQATAANSREHNHANVLTLGAGMIGTALARAIVSTWLDTPTGSGRHARRVDKIVDIERRFLKEE